MHDSDSDDDRYNQAAELQTPVTNRQTPSGQTSQSDLAAAKQDTEMIQIDTN